MYLSFCPYLFSGFTLNTSFYSEKKTISSSRYNIANMLTAYMNFNGINRVAVILKEFTEEIKLSA